MAASNTVTNPAKLGKAQQGAPQNFDYVDLNGIAPVSDLHARYATQALGGNIYHACSAVGGVSIPAPSSTAPICVLWNQAGSGLNIVLVEVAISYVSGTTAPGGIHMGFQAGTGAGIGTPISAFTHVDPFTGIVGNVYDQPRIRFAPATTTFGAALTQGPFLGLSYGAVVAATTNGPQESARDLYGLHVIPPGVAIAPCAVVLTTALYNFRWSFYVTPT